MKYSIYTFTTERQLRREFWKTFPDLPRRSLKEVHRTEIRETWCDWLDGLSNYGDISEELAFTATL